MKSFPIQLSSLHLDHSRTRVLTCNEQWIWGTEGFPGGSDGKESACNAGDLCSIPGLHRSPGEGNSNSLQYSCLENPTDSWAIVYGVAKSQT